MSAVNEPTRVMPQAVELEEAVLGAVMLEVHAPGTALSILKSGMFYKDEHNVIFAAFERMYEAGEPIDIKTVYNHLRCRKTTEIITGKQYATEADKVGGAYYISQLTNRVASAANLEYHCRIIVQKYVLRQIILNCSRAVNRSYNEDPDIFGVLDEIGDLLLLRDNLVAQSSEAPAVGNLIGKEVEDYERRVAANATGKTVGVPTGHVQLDRLTTGWEGGRLIVLAAHTGEGKSAEAVGTYALTAARSGIPVLVFSLENTEIETVQRLLSNIAEVNNHEYKRGRLIAEDLRRMERARGILEDLPLFIDATPGLSITEIRSRSRRLKQKHNIGLVVVDYIQIAKGAKSDVRHGNREQEVAGISRGLKNLAKELDIPVIGLSQFSREGKKRGGRPQLTDLRESGALEHDADMVIFIHHPDMTEDERGKLFGEESELIVAKHRGGGTGTVKVKFVPEHTKFVDVGLTTYQQAPLNPNVDFQHESKKDPF